MSLIKYFNQDSTKNIIVAVKLKRITQKDVFLEYISNLN